MEKFLNDEQIAHLKSLDKKKKQLSFLLECILENILGKSKKIENKNEFKSQNQIAKERLNHIESNPNIEWNGNGNWFFKSTNNVTGKASDFSNKEVNYRNYQDKSTEDLHNLLYSGEIEFSDLLKILFYNKKVKNEQIAKKETLEETAERIIEETIWKPLEFDMLKDEEASLVHQMYCDMRDYTNYKGWTTALRISELVEIENIVLKYQQSAKNDELIYTKEYFLQELEKAFNASREVRAIADNTYPQNVVRFVDFNDYLKTMKNE